MRICLVYDCLFPHTVGGAERWYRNLAERLAAEGHDVTYLTLCQWEPGEHPDVDPRVRVIAVGPRMALYTDDGRRRIGPPLRFGAGVLGHLARHGRRYDAVHTCAFPYFSLLAAAAVRPVWRYGLVVDWFEVWSVGYWRDYLGRAGGRIGTLVQRLCAAVPQRAFCFSELHAQRLRDEHLRGPVQVLRGLYDESREPPPARPADPLVVFAGRLIPEKRAPAVVPAVLAASRRIAGLRGIVFGDGPERPAVLAAIAAAGPDAPVEAPGFVEEATVEEAIGRALCMLLPSRREGYGMVVVEASARGVPSIVVSEPDNAATELVEPGENGVVAASAGAEDLADAIERVHSAGAELRERTRRWFASHREELSIESSLRAVVDSYRELSARR